MQTIPSNDVTQCTFDTTVVGRSNLVWFGGKKMICDATHAMQHTKAQMYTYIDAELSQMWRTTELQSDMKHVQGYNAPQIHRNAARAQPPLNVRVLAIQVVRDIERSGTGSHTAAARRERASLTQTGNTLGQVSKSLFEL
jgi:hypothetical protein